MLKVIDNYNDLISLIDEKTNKKVLLHSCCGPCSSACIDLLIKGLSIDVFYSNSNIDTLDEFNKRVVEQEKIVQILSPNSKVIIDKYCPEAFYESVNGLESLGERSERCYKCYEMRMLNTIKYAKEHHYDYWTTTLSISPHKNSNWINEIGIRLSNIYKVPFLYSNFKLKDGFKKSIEFSKQYGLYRQDYCGCHFSKIERGIINE